MARQRYRPMDFDQPKRGSGMLPWLLIVLLGLLGYLGYRSYRSAPADSAPAPEVPRIVRPLPLPEPTNPGQSAPDGRIGQPPTPPHSGEIPPSAPPR